MIRSIMPVLLMLMVCLLPCLACADELRIIDESGLVRAAKVIQGSSATVTVEIVSPAHDAIPNFVGTLRHDSGLAPNINGRVHGNRFEFVNVPAGEWKLLVAPEEVVLGRVRID